MASPIRIETSLSQPVVAAGEELLERVYALLRVRPGEENGARPRLDLTFLLDASATMYHFRLDPAERARWLQVARQRGDVAEQLVDGRPAMVWVGQTMRELQDQVSTPMHCALRGLWRGLGALEPEDRICVVAFADQAMVILDDAGQPNLPARRGVVQSALAPLTSGSLQSGMGHNTRLAQAFRLAFQRLEQAAGQPVLHRAVLVSDGQVEDRDACLPLLEEALERDLVISAIGVGDEFDEEFLMRVADETRGRYYYAPTAKDLEAALGEEFAAMSSALARQATVRVRPAPEVVFHELYQTGPAMTRFPAVWVEEESWLYRLGTVPGNNELQLAASFAAPAFPEGEVSLGTIEFHGLPVGEGPPIESVTEVRLLAASDPVLATNRNDAVMDVVRRLEVYLEERAAQAAQERGDVDSATRHLHTATRLLRRLGQDTLASEMEAEAHAVGAAARDQARTKRIKSATRRLASRTPATQELPTRHPGAPGPPAVEGTRRLPGAPPSTRERPGGE